MDNKHIKLVAISVFVIFVVSLLFPYSNKTLKRVRNHTGKTYELTMQPYSLPKDLLAKNLDAKTPANSVPVLMYHGVITKGELGANTSRENFISQMEMLKREGYQTITVDELYKFLVGKFILPPKPILITFDDGRKDSFYTTYNVLEKLGFKASVFVATIKADSNDPFYLSWDELKSVRDTGKWEILAHGKKSHDEVVIDERGTMGRFYSSRIFVPGKGLETVSQFEKRIEDDYIAGIEELKNNLGINPQYFAIPLSDYGTTDEITNHDGAYKFNDYLTKKYFKASFTQATSFNTFYNYKDSNPHGLVRLEVKNISSEELKGLLQKFSYKPEYFSYFSELKQGEMQFLYGSYNLKNGIELTTSKESPASRILFGNRGWKNYSLKATFERSGSRSESFLIYYKDENNYVSLNFGGENVWLTENISGLEREIAGFDSSILSNKNEIELRVFNGKVSASINGIGLTNIGTTKIQRGAAGFTVWDPKGVGKSTITKIEIKPIKSTPTPFPLPIDSSGQSLELQSYRTN